MKIRIHPAADDEAKQAAEWYEDQRDGLGEEFCEALAKRYQTIIVNPQLFPHLETLQSPREIRRYLMHRFPFVIIYEVKPDEVMVLAVAHARRRPNYWIRRQEK